MPRWFGHGLLLPPDALYRQRTLRPPTLHLTRRKRRAGGLITTDFNLDADLASEGTQRGTPRKRALLGRTCGDNGSPTVDLTEAQAGRSADDVSPEWAHSPGVGLMDTVARLQREVEELRSDPLFNCTGVAPSSPQRSHLTVFTSTKVPRFAGLTSWDQYRQIFDSIVVSNGWEDATAALQLFSHLEGDALNVALLVPVNRRASRMGLIDARTAHYGLLGPLANYRRQFERVTWTAVTDPSIFATELETLALKAFGDMSHLAHLRLVRDQFITGHDSCALRRHLDSVSPETPMRDIVDRCRVWESHTEFEGRRGWWHRSPDRSCPVYTISDGGNTGDDLREVADDMTPEAQAGYVRIADAAAAYAGSIATEGQYNPFRVRTLDTTTWGMTNRSGFTKMEVLIQNLLPVAGPTQEQPNRESGCRDWSTVLCFSCGSHRWGPLYIVLIRIVLIFVGRMIFWSCWSPYAMRRTACR